MNEAIKSVARYVRDLLDYDESLIKFDRRNTQQEDLVTDYIVVNSSAIQNKLSHGKSYNGDTEIMTYSSSDQQAITLEFYGDNAYQNAELFSILNDSQKAKEVSRTLGLTIYKISNVTDVRQIMGYQYGNRVHVEFNIQYCPNVAVSLLRVDTVEPEFLVDK